MGRRWSALAACLAVTFCAAVAHSQPGPAEGQQPPTEEAKTDAQPGPAEGQDQPASPDAEPAGPAPEAEPAVTAPVDAERADEVPEPDNRYPNCEFDSIEECDLAAQQSMAEHTIYMNRAAWVSVLLTAVGVILIWRTLLYTRTAADAAVAAVDEARKSTDAAARAAEAAAEANRLSTEALIADQRPWISVVGCEPSSALRWDSLQCYIQLDVRMKNVGKSPALNTEVWMKLITERELPELEREQIAFADKIRDGKRFFNITVFPEQTERFGVPIAIKTGDIKEQLARRYITMGNFISLFLDALTTIPRSEGEPIRRASFT